MDQFLNETLNIIVQTGKSIDKIGILPAFTVISVIAGIVSFFIKRSFASIDFDNQQKTQHSGWLLQRTVLYAEKHYTHLARRIMELRLNLDEANKTRNSQIIQYAYSSAVKFVEQYIKFEKKTGANFLFIERMSENLAISNFQSLFLSLPFDRNDIETISNSFTSKQFQSFQNWITSVHCNNSKKIALDSLYNLAEVLDLQSEKILHYDEFLRTLREIKATRYKRRITGWILSLVNFFNDKNSHVFYIHRVVPKYTKANSKVVVLGKGFNDKQIDSFELLMNNVKLQRSVIDNNSIVITIPANTQIGTYDITANFTYKNKKGNEPMGMVIHITN